MDMEKNPDIRFMVDHMLIKLGKYLRIIGYDAAWDKNLRTHELIVRANQENRMFLTRNTKLSHQYPAVNRVMILTTTDPVEQLSEVVNQVGLDMRSGLFSKCIKCNVVLDVVADKKEIEGFVHPNVYSRHERFFKCPVCGTVFWHGSHVANTCSKLGITQADKTP
ncbi:MAG: Mut7-C RNAse domain-containing protein [Kiritimatiellae bacterium]|nr:Mut7-C RNAse domain-containing protein [Kiritimatiellia bacterium]MDD5520286.1 Mut7-C RNAse domain-containing protein [Kiritimatiellia bacterium]